MLLGEVPDTSFRVTGSRLSAEHEALKSGTARLHLVVPVSARQTPSCQAGAARRGSGLGPGNRRGWGEGRARQACVSEEPTTRFLQGPHAGPGFGVTRGEVTSSPPLFRVSGQSCQGPAEHSPGSGLGPRKCLQRDRPVALGPLLRPSLWKTDVGLISWALNGAGAMQAEVKVTLGNPPGDTCWAPTVPSMLAQRLLRAGGGTRRRACLGRRVA